MFISSLNCVLDHVTIVARRGILNAAFTIKELRELFKIKSIKCEISSQENFDNLDVDQILKKLSRPRKRLTEFMLKLSTQESNPEQDKTLTISFLRTPKEILGEENSKKVTGVKFMRNKYDLDFIESKEQLDREEILNTIPCPANNSVESEVIPGNLVIRSIGYKNVNIDQDVPFDKKLGVVSNKLGKVIGKDGLYCTGWIKRGPRGKSNKH